jgi:hypothetical protein
MVFVIDTDDQEVSDLTKNPVPPMFQTAESVAKFMRSVNRIRFNSMSNEVETILAKEKYSCRRNSRSCPNLHKMPVPEEEGEDLLSRSVSTTFKTSSGTPKVTEVKEKEMVTSTPNTSMPKTSNVTVNMTSHVVNNITYQRVDSSGVEKESDFVKVLKSVLVPTKVAVCQRCSAQCFTAQSQSGMSSVSYIY